MKCPICSETVISYITTDGKFEDFCPSKEDFFHTFKQRYLKEDSLISIVVSTELKNNISYKVSFEEKICSNYIIYLNRVNGIHQIKESVCKIKCDSISLENALSYLNNIESLLLFF